MAAGAASSSVPPGWNRPNSITRGPGSGEVPRCWIGTLVPLTVMLPDRAGPPVLLATLKFTAIGSGRSGIVVIQSDVPSTCHETPSPVAIVTRPAPPQDGNSLGDASATRQRSGFVVLFRVRR